MTRDHTHISRDEVYRIGKNTKGLTMPENLRNTDSDGIFDVRMETGTCCAVWSPYEVP